MGRDCTSPTWAKRSRSARNALHSPRAKASLVRVRGVARLRVGLRLGIFGRRRDRRDERAARRHLLDVHERGRQVLARVERRVLPRSDVRGRKRLQLQGDRRGPHVGVLHAARVSLPVQLEPVRRRATVRCGQRRRHEPGRERRGRGLGRRGVGLISEGPRGHRAAGAASRRAPRGARASARSRAARPRADRCRSR